MISIFIKDSTTYAIVLLEALSGIDMLGIEMPRLSLLALIQQRTFEARAVVLVLF